MKSYPIITTIALALFSSGCNKPDSGAPATTETQKATSDATTEMKKAPDAVAAQPAPPTPTPPAPVENAVTPTPPVAAVDPAVTDKAAADAKMEAANMTSKTQQSIDNVRKLLADKDWAGALKALNDLASQKLTPDQQTMVDGLKQQAQQLAQGAAASKAGDQANKALGNLLNK